MKKDATNGHMCLSPLTVHVIISRAATCWIQGLLPGKGHRLVTLILSLTLTLSLTRLHNIQHTKYCTSVIDKMILARILLSVEI